MQALPSRESFLLSSRVQDELIEVATVFKAVREFPEKFRI
jgi:hypothetical protein